MEVYEHYFNHAYSYDLVTLQECVKSLTAESTSFIHLPVGGRRHEGSRSDIVDPSTSESAFWPLLPNSSLNLRADRGRLLASAPPVPEVGTDVTIDSEFEQFKGRVISVDNSVLIMEVVRTRGTGAMIHSGRSGHLTFKNPAAAFVVAKKAIQKAMWQNHPFNWLKNLLLAHNSNVITPTNPPFITEAWTRSLPPLNTQQNIASARSAQRSRELSDIVTMIQGPPGTGKTRLNGFFVLNCIQRQQWWLLTAETHYAVQVCADRIYADLQAVDGNYDGIWLIERADLDSTAFTVPSSDFPDDRAEISELTRTKIIQRLRGHAEPKRFSLTSHISDRLRLFRDQQRTRADEAAILKDLNVTKLALDHFSQSEEDVDEWKRIYKQFDKVWEDTQEYYIRTQARGIIVTAASAMTMMLRVFRPQQSIVNEGSLPSSRLSLSFRGFLIISGRFSSLGIRAKKRLLCLTRIPS